VGGTLAKKWIEAGHSVLIGARFPLSDKNIKLANVLGEDCFTSIENAVKQSDVILLSTPAMLTIDVVKSLGDTSGKIIIDAMNIVMGKGPQGYKNTTDAIIDNTQTKDVVKCFNTTGFNNMANTNYGEMALDLFVAGDSKTGVAASIELAKDAGFEECYHIGGNDKFELMEQFAWFWINLAMFQGQGREIGFKLLKR
ncbi:MAG: NAD(P)-binding domain-containing protein, partial [Bacteroidia bacterium]|nr:NAD(P)-binding domain-containing protein [Bacteroidia bacterium]